MKKVLALLGGGLLGILILSAACGGEGDNSSPPSPTTAKIATNAATATPIGSMVATLTAADLANDLATLRTDLQDKIAKALAGDEQGVQEGSGDKAIDAIIRALWTKDSTLADKLETLKLGYDDNPDLAVVAQDAQKVLDLLDQVATSLNIRS